MIVTKGRYMVDASSACDRNRSVEVQATIIKRPRQGNGVSAHRRDDIGPRSQGLRHPYVAITERQANKNNREARDCCPCRGCRKYTSQPGDPAFFRETGDHFGQPRRSVNAPKGRRKRSTSKKGIVSRLAGSRFRQALMGSPLRPIQQQHRNEFRLQRGSQ